MSVINFLGPKVCRGHKGVDTEFRKHFSPFRQEMSQAVPVGERCRRRPKVDGDYEGKGPGTDRSSKGPFLSTHLKSGAKVVTSYFLERREIVCLSFRFKLTSPIEWYLES